MVNEPGIVAHSNSIHISARVDTKVVVKSGEVAQWPGLSAY